MKIIKKSKRGLTFSFTSDTFPPGTRYNYSVFDGEIVITPSVNGIMKISRKKSGAKYKSLVDIRAKKVLAKIASADHIELEICENEIVAHICKKVVSKSKSINISEILECREIETISLSDSLVSGGESYVQMSLFEDSEDYCYRDICKPLESIFRVISLFSGAGMLDYPFSLDKRYKIILANDIGEGQAQSYRANIGEMMVKKDIRQLSLIPSSDLVLGGPSCKPFSNVNRHHTRLKDHPDYFLIKEYIRVIKQSNPKVFVIENVPEFISTAEGAILADIMDKLSEYSFSVKKVIDCEVGGYTRRRRVIVIGSRIGTINLSDCHVTKYKTAKEALEKVDASWYNYNDVSKARSETRLRMSYVKNGSNWRDVPDNLRTRSRFSDYLRRIDPDKPAPAIVNVRKANIMPPVEYITGKQRCLSVAECSALMGFPKEFRFCGTLDERQQQVANGVPYMIARLIKNAVTAALENILRGTAYV